MTIEYIGRDKSDGVVIGQSSGKLSFYGMTTPVTQPATITTVDTTTITAVQVATGTITHVIAACNSLITDSQLQAEAINSLISRLQSLNIIASS